MATQTVTMSAEEVVAFVLDVAAWRDLDDDERQARADRIRFVLTTINPTTGKKWTQVAVAALFGITDGGLRGWLSDYPAKPQVGTIFDRGARIDDNRKKLRSGVRHNDAESIANDVVEVTDLGKAEQVYHALGRKIADHPDRKARQARDADIRETVSGLLKPLSLLGELGRIYDTLVGIAGGYADPGYWNEPERELWELIIESVALISSHMQEPEEVH